MQDSVSYFGTERATTLEELKVFGRDANQSDPIFTKEVSYFTSVRLKSSKEDPRESRYYANMPLKGPTINQP